MPLGRRPVVLEDAGAHGHDVGLDGHVVLEVAVDDPVEELGVRVGLAQLLQLAGDLLASAVRCLRRGVVAGRAAWGAANMISRPVLW